MSEQDSAETPRFLPWMVVGAAGWSAGVCGALYLLPRSLIGPVVLAGSPIIAALVVVSMPRSNLKRELVRFVKSWLACSFLYAFFVAAASLILLLGCFAVGYLPYSDRPGPGWGNIPPHFPRLEEIEYFGGWAAVFLFPMCVLWGSIFFFLAAWSGWFGAPRWVMRDSGAILCGVVALLATDAAGWIISIAAFPVYGTGVAGALFGTLVLPRFLIPLGSSIARWQRATMIGLAHFAVAAYITFPFWRQYL